MGLGFLNQVTKNDRRKTFRRMLVTQKNLVPLLPHVGFEELGNAIRRQLGLFQSTIAHDDRVVIEIDDAWNDVLAG